MRLMQVSFLMTTFLSAAVLAGEADVNPQSSNSVRLAVSLSDGSRLIGQPAISSLSVSTSFAVVTIPFDQLERLSRSRGNGKTTIKCVNGDQFKGLLMVSFIPIFTAIGKFDLKTDLITDISLPGKEKPQQVADTPEKRRECINNLRMIDAAKEQWALAERKGDGEEPEPAGVAQYMKGGRIPKCPSGGIYKLNPIGKAPECSIPGHKLTEP